MAYNPEHLDGHLDRTDTERIRQQALALLDHADAAGWLPTPLSHLIESAGLISNEEFVLQTQERRELRETYGDLVDRAEERLQGFLHVPRREIWIRSDLHPKRKRFVSSHELGHYILPEHKEVFAYLDDQRRLSPDIQVLYERQANQAAIEILAQGDRLRLEADDSPLTIKLMGDLGKKFDISLQATARRVAEESRQAVALIICFRGDAGTTTSPHVYCSETFEERFRWMELGHMSKVLHRTVDAFKDQDQREPLVVKDAYGEGATLSVDGAVTEKAVLVLLVPMKRTRAPERLSPDEKKLRARELLLRDPRERRTPL